MKTKIIPFDLETAKKIQAGEIEGRIVRRKYHKQVCEILEFYAEWQTHCDEKFLIVKVPAHDFERGQLWIYHQDGRAHHGVSDEMWYDLVLEVPNTEPQFKPFDKVLVRRDENDDGDPDTWVISYFMDKSIAGYRVLNGEWFDQCIPYEGNEYLLGTTNKPMEE